MPEQLRGAVDLLRARLPDLVAVYLFGSLATGQTSPESDVDLAVLGRERLEPADRWDIQERLAARLHRDVDLVDLRSASAVMRVQVLERSNLLFDGDPQARALFEATALSAYARLNEERKWILLDVHARGSVHG
jgi:predicted nucleotidyltransferase